MATDVSKPVIGAGLTGTARTIALWVILLAFFMDLLDTTIVNVGIPSIQKDLGTSYSSIQWIIAGYALAFALFLITGGRLGDIYGYKKLFLIGIAGFTIASALCGFAPSTEVLIAARIFQGLMAALMVPQILSTIQVMYTTTEERQGISAFYGALAGVATVAGPIVGALLITGNLWGLEWRTIFLVNIPVGVAAFILGIVYLPNARSPHPLRVDFIGVIIILVAMLMLMYPLIQGRELDWPSWALISMGASILVFVLFGWSQVQKDKRDGSPLVVPHLFKSRSFVAGVALNGAFFAVIAGFFLTFTLFLQIGLGYSILKAGLTGIPFSIGVSLAAGLSGPVFVPKFGRNIISAGPVVMGLGFLIFVWTINHFGADVTPYEMIPSLLLAGLGMGFVVASVYPFILAEVPLKDAGSASGVINAVGQIGGAMGVAIIGVIFFGLIGSQATTSVESVKDKLATELSGAGVPSFAQGSIVSGFEACFHDRANAKDFLDVPESCKQGEESLASFAATQPELAKKVGDAIASSAAVANQRNFTRSMERTLYWQIGALVVIFFLTFMLPKRPLTEEELARAAAEGTPVAAL
jgi:EmrB/QacA subfamily drug resistance transporter